MIIFMKKSVYNYKKKIQLCKFDSIMYLIVMNIMSQCNDFGMNMAQTYMIFTH